MGLYTGGRGFVFGILWYVIILQFQLETLYFDNNEYCYILLKTYSFCLQLRRELNNDRNDLISGL